KPVKSCEKIDGWSFSLSSSGGEGWGEEAVFLGIRIFSHRLNTAGLFPAVTGSLSMLEVNHHRVKSERILEIRQYRLDSCLGVDEGSKLQRPSFDGVVWFLVQHPGQQIQRLISCRRKAFARCSRLLRMQQLLQRL